MTSEDFITEPVPNDIKEDLEIRQGDFFVNVSDQQHIQHILKAKPGQFYQHAFVGLGIVDFRAASLNPQRLKQLIKIQLKADNYLPTVVDISPDFIVNIDAERLK